MACSECYRLRGECESATAEHGRLKAQLDTALFYDSGIRAIAERAMEAAAQRLESIREQIRDHEADHTQGAAGVRK
jgi:hypothetical protein